MTQVRAPPLCPLYPEPISGQPPARGRDGGRRLRHEPPQGGPGDLHGAVPKGSIVKLRVDNISILKLIDIYCVCR